MKKTSALFAAHYITRHTSLAQGARGAQLSLLITHTVVQMKEKTKQTRTKTHVRCPTQKFPRTNTAGNPRIKAAENCPQCTSSIKHAALACIFQRAARISPHLADSCNPTHPNITQTEVWFGRKHIHLVKQQHLLHTLVHKIH